MTLNKIKNEKFKSIIKQIFITKKFILKAKTMNQFFYFQ